MIQIYLILSFLAIIFCLIRFFNTTPLPQSIQVLFVLTWVLQLSFTVFMYLK